MSVVARRIPAARLPPGTQIQISIGTSRKFWATVVEDLGPIAPDGSNVVRVRAKLDSLSPESEFDVTVDVASLNIRE